MCAIASCNAVYKVCACAIASCYAFCIACASGVYIKRYWANGTKPLIVV